MSETYLISIGAGEMLELGRGDDPAEAGDDYYASMDAFGSGPDEVGETFSVSVLRIPEELMPEVDDLMEDRFDEALPDVVGLVVGRTRADWQTVDVIIGGGDRTTSLRG